MRILEVTWVDSCSNTRAWLSEDEARDWGTDGLLCVTVGHLLQRNRRGITLVMGFAANCSVSGAWFIPAGCIRKVRYLR